MAWNQMWGQQTPMQYDLFTYQSLSADQQLTVQQNWQQWQTYQQQYAQWQQQYGEQFTKQQQAVAQPPPPPEPPSVKPPPPPPPSEPQVPTQQPWAVYQQNQNKVWGGNRNQNNQSRGGSWNKDADQSPAVSLPQKQFTSPWETPSTTPTASAAPNLLPATSAQVSSGVQKTTEELEFDEQFRKWEIEFENWKKQNANHPDRKAYAEYERKFEDCRRRLLERREQMRKKRMEQLAAAIVPEIIPEPLREEELFDNFEEADELPTADKAKAVQKAQERMTSLFKPNTAGIPGLDLVETVKEKVKEPPKPKFDEIDAHIDLEDEVPETKPTTPMSSSSSRDTTQSNNGNSDKWLRDNSKVQSENLAALTQNLNQVLGDEKVLALLHLLGQKKQQLIEEQAAAPRGGDTLGKGPVPLMSLDTAPPPTWDKQSTSTKSMTDTDDRTMQIWETPQTKLQQPPHGRQFDDRRNRNDPIEDYPGQNEQLDPPRGLMDKDESQFGQRRGFNKSFDRNQDNFDKQGLNDRNQGPPSRFDRDQEPNNRPFDRNQGSNRPFDRNDQEPNQSFGRNQEGPNRPFDQNNQGPNKEFGRNNDQPFDRGTTINPFDRDENLDIPFEHEDTEDDNHDPNDGFDNNESNEQPFDQGGPNNRPFGGPHNRPFGGPTNLPFNRQGPNNMPFDRRGSNNMPFDRQGPHFGGPGPNNRSFDRQGPNNQPFGGPGPNNRPFDRQGPNNQQFGGPGPNNRSFDRQGPNNQPFGGSGPNNQPFGGPGPNNQPFGGPGPNNQPFGGPGPNNQPFRGPGPNIPPFDSQGPNNQRFGGPGPNQQLGGPGPNQPFGGPGPNQQFGGPGPNQQFEGPSPNQPLNNQRPEMNPPFDRQPFDQRISGPFDNRGPGPNSPLKTNQPQNDKMNQGPQGGPLQDDFFERFKHIEDGEERLRQIRVAYELELEKHRQNVENRRPKMDFFIPKQVIDYQNKPTKYSRPPQRPYGVNEEGLFVPKKIFDYDHKTTSKRDEAFVEFKPQQSYDNPLPNKRPHVPGTHNPHAQKRMRKDGTEGKAKGIGEKAHELEVISSDEDAYDSDSDVEFVAEEKKAEMELEALNLKNKEMEQNAAIKLDEVKRSEKKIEPVTEIKAAVQQKPEPPLKPIEAPKEFKEKEKEIVTQKPEPLFKNVSVPAPKIDIKKKVEEKKVEDVVTRPVRIPSGGRNIISIDDILSLPGRLKRPSKICIVMRGIPGSGKTYLAKLIKDKEASMGGSTPRILNIDDYFMTEHEEMETCAETGQKRKVKKMVYEYEKEMEPIYMQYLVKSFKKTITDRLFDFIVVDCINNTLEYYDEFVSFAKSNNFTVYTCLLQSAIDTCVKRNIHNRTAADVQQYAKHWMRTPENNTVLDVTPLLQAPIPTIEIPDDPVTNEEENKKDDEEQNPVNDDDDDSNMAELGMSSKWDTGRSEANLARLDGTNKPLRHETMEDYLQIDEWAEVKTTKPGQKRVRWADIEEKRAQDKMRAIGFVVGQTDWKRMMDPTEGSSALTQTKYIERVRKN